MNLADIRGLICIDCWDNPDHDSYYNTVNNTINFKQFDSIVVASYETALDSEDVALSSTLLAYSYYNFTPEVLLPILKETRNRKTSKHIQQHLGKNSFLLLDDISFNIHVNHLVPHIKDWLVIGGSWGQCTHHRPLGFNKMLGLPYNFYAAPWSMYSMNPGKNFSVTANDFATDRLPWIDHGNDLYQLQNAYSSSADRSP
jgi:hypothetical protein